MKNKGGAMDKVREYFFWFSIFGLISSVFFDSREVEIFFSILLIISLLESVIRNKKEAGTKASFLLIAYFYSLKSNDRSFG